MIPPPTLCPEERVRRRMAWRNDRTFYRRTCDLSGDEFVSLYPQDSHFTVYRPSAWYGDKWNPLDFGREYDFSKPFFEQFQELQRVVPRLGIDIVNCQNSEYCNYCGDDKNCYLDIAGEANEDCYFNLFTKYSKNCCDCTFVYHCELCYEAIQCYECYQCMYSMYLDGCNDCTFCFDLKGCKNCLLCTNQRNKEYYILNEQHTKEEYEKKLQELKLNSESARKKVFAIWRKMRTEKGIYRDMYNLNCENCIGNNIKNSKNCFFCFNAINSEDCAYLYDVLDAKDCTDLSYSLYKPEASIELISTLQMRFSACCLASHYCTSSYYCEMCNNSHDLFGCIGLNHGEYCILNKQYTKEEYEELVPRIIEHMMQTKEFGNFFPIERSPHAYNETVAQEYMPMTKEDADTRGYPWKDIKEEIPQVEKTIPSEQLPDAIQDIPDDVTNWAIVCEETKKPFRIIPQELAFYRKIGIPLPRRSPDQRHRDRINLRNPRALWKGACSKCGKDITTSYDTSRPEKVWCESCYLAEVY